MSQVVATLLALARLTQIIMLVATLVFMVDYHINQRFDLAPAIEMDFEDIIAKLKKRLSRG